MKGLCGHLVLVQSTLYTLYTLYTVYFTGPISAKNNTALSARCTVATAAAALHRHSRTLQPSPPVSTHFTTAAAMWVLGPLLTVTVLEHLRCDACSSSLELQCCSDNTIIIKLQRSINNLQSSFNFAAARSTLIVDSVRSSDL